MKWFLNQNTKIQGPYLENELQYVLQSLTSEMDQCYVWARGMDEWISAKNWRPGMLVNQNVSLDKILITEAGFQKNSTMSITAIQPGQSKPAAAKSSLQKSGPSKIYKVQYDFVEQKPMNIDELIEFTRTREDVNKIAIYDAEAKNWHEIYAIKEVADSLGLSRRKNTRIPILAQFSGQSGKGKKINSRVITISIGGMGITDTYDLSIGEEIRGQIASPHFFTPLNIEAEVTFCGNDGYIGLRFTQINDDTRALITEYINRFEQN